MSAFENSSSQTDPQWNRFSDTIQHRSQTVSEDGASPYQSLLVSLVADTVTAYRQKSLGRQAGQAVIWLAVLPAVAAAVYGVMAMARWLIDRLEIPNGDRILVGLAVVVTVMAFASRIGSASSRIDLAGKPKITRLRLGRCEAANDLRRLVWCLLMVAVLYGLQTSLLQLVEIGFDVRYDLRNGSTTIKPQRFF